MTCIAPGIAFCLPIGVLGIIGNLSAVFPKLGVAACIDTSIRLSLHHHTMCLLFCSGAESSSLLITYHSLLR